MRIALPTSGRRPWTGWRGSATGVLLLLLPMAAAAAPPVDEARRMALVITDATARGDADAIAALYAPTALLLPPDGTIVARREKIRAQYAANQSLGKNKLEFGQIQVDGDDTQATVVWTWTLTITLPTANLSQIKSTGRSMLYLKHLPEGWQIFLDMYQTAPAR